MLEEIDSPKIAVLLMVGFALASILGYFTFRIKLSPILGYLIAGYLIGPYSPGYVGDLKIAEQLAEIGVILMMFGVGLHFKWQDLVHVKAIAIPGAVGQTLIASIAGTALIYSVGWSLESGIIFGLSIGVASTVVLVRMLSDRGILNTPNGHIAMGWLIVEDIITVVILLLLPTLAASSKGETLSFVDIGGSLLIVVLKFSILVALLFTLGHKCIGVIFSKIMLTKSHELFTLTILALTLLIAIGSSLLFGTSIALGAFISGMVIGQTNVKHQVSINATPIKDAFVVIFFLSIGMLFNPQTIIEHYFLFFGALAIILIVKPVTAFLIAIGLRYPVKTALTVALALAQIGEFSFILSEEASRYDILPDIGYDVIVASSLVSIAINPLLFKIIKV